MSSAIDQQIVTFQQQFKRVKDEVSKVIVGYSDIIDGVIMSLLANGHVLLEGVPGLGKTKLVSTLSAVMHLKFSRIQFTPDLMPADITGTNVVQEDALGAKFLEFQPGPIFSNIVLADEVNRATPKTQSALLEAMEERSVTVGKTSHKLISPFFVLATQNPLEMEGTYPLPEAQLDRFFFKVHVPFPSAGELVEFADFRPYAVGDDIRQIDWNLYARMERFFLKLFVAEEELTIHLLVDNTASMDWGEPNKFLYARQAAGAFGYIALSSLDRVTVTAFGDKAARQLPGVRGKRGALPLFTFLQKLPAGARGSLLATCRRYIQTARNAGPLLLCSDLMDPNWEDALRALSS